MLNEIDKGAHVTNSNMQKKQMVRLSDKRTLCSLFLQKPYCMLSAI